MFDEINIQPYGNCFFCCISYYLYNNQSKHLDIRGKLFDFIVENKEEYYTFFQNDCDNNNQIEESFNNYVNLHKKEGEFAGDIEFSAVCKLLNINLIILTKGFKGLNVYNIYTRENDIIADPNTIYIIYINKNHFNYLQLISNDTEEKLSKTETIYNLIKTNLNEWEKIRKREYPVALHWSPNIFNEMYNFYKNKELPEERFKSSSNISQSIIRFKELAKKKFILINDRLYFIKKSDTKRLEDGTFEDFNKVKLQKILYIFEILPYFDNIHKTYGHISANNVANKIKKQEVYFDGIEFLAESYSKDCPECYSKYYSKKILKQQKIILDEGPHYRLLIDYTYLDKKYYGKNTKYKYVIDCIDHFSKFYWGYLTVDKSAKTTLNKTKMFVQINKKPIIIQTDNGTEFQNQLFNNYLKEEEINHILSRPHHPQTNGCLERYHRELKKHMKIYLDNIKDFNDKDVEDALNEYILYHNNTKKYSTKYAPNNIRDLEDPVLIENIINNIIKSFKKHMLDPKEIIDENEKLLLWNNLIIRNNIYIKNDKDKKGAFTYPSLFNKYKNNDIINIVIKANISKDLIKDMEINVDINTCILVPEFVFNYFIIKFSNNYEIIKVLSEDDNDINDNNNIDYMVYYKDEELNNNNKKVEQVNLFDQTNLISKIDTIEKDTEDTNVELNAFDNNTKKDSNFKENDEIDSVFNLEDNKQNDIKRKKKSKGKKKKKK